MAKFVKTSNIILWLTLLIWFSHVRHHICELNGTLMDIEHAPLEANRIKAPTRQWIGSKIPGTNDSFNIPLLTARKPADMTPDWKVDDVPPIPMLSNVFIGVRQLLPHFGEFERPYKLQPFTMSAAFWDSSKDNYDHAQLLGCYCCAVYKKFIPLSTCAVLTTRHILTTATATELVLKDHGHADDLEGILGAWYDVTHYGSNTSAYMTPSRIHYHPKYVMPENVNASHPIPAMYDLAVWAGTVPFHHYVEGTVNRQAYICNRAGSYWLQFGSPVLGSVKQPVAIIVGFQFMLWFKRKPMPFYKYAVKTQKYSGKCPKTEWGWFFCVWGRWAMLGLDSGAALHRSTQGHSWLYDGLLGINSFSMDLRAKEMTHYFVPVENHSALSFMYDAYMGRIPFRFLDYRFYNSEWHAPYPKPWHKIEWKYDEPPEQWVWQLEPPSFF